ncbi:hypothetical protein NBRC10513_004908 [Rhodotorula toruloides]
MRTTTLLAPLAALAALISAQHQDQPSHYNHQRQRRWVWGPSIIQDPTSGQDTATLPPIGSNVNQFTSEFGATITTPDSTPTMPTSPPLESSSSSSATSQSFGGGKQGAAAAGTTTPASSAPIRRIPFVERKSSSLAAASSQPSPPTTTSASSSSASTTPATSRLVGHRTTTPPPPPPPTPTTPPPTPQPTTTPAETHRVLWHERHESYLSSILGSKRDVPPSPTTSPASTTTPVGGYGRSTPDPGTALHPPTFAGPPGTMPSGGVPGSYAISHLPSSASSTTTPAQAVETGGVLDVVESAVGEVAGVVGGAVKGVGGMIGLGKREASSPARFQVVVKRRADHSTSHQRRRRTVSVE